MNKYERKIEELLSKKRITYNILCKIEAEFDKLLLYLKYQGYPLSYCVLDRDWNNYGIGFNLVLSQGASTEDRYISSCDSSYEICFRASKNDTMWLLDDIKKYRGKVTEITKLVKQNLQHVYRHTEENSSFKRHIETACSIEEYGNFFRNAWNSLPIPYYDSDILGREIHDRGEYTQLYSNIALAFRLDEFPEAAYNRVRHDYTLPVGGEIYRVLEYNVSYMNSPDYYTLTLTLVPPDHPVNIHELENFPGRIGSIVLNV